MYGLYFGCNTSPQRRRATAMSEAMNDGSFDRVQRSTTMKCDNRVYHTFKSVIDEEAGLIDIEEHTSGFSDIYRTRIETKEKMVHYALMKLGWLPPEDTLMRRLCMLYGAIMLKINRWATRQKLRLQSIAKEK
jgi:hypothetical protein